MGVSYRIEDVFLDMIEIEPTRRKLDHATLPRLADSMKEVGLRAPIWVRYVAGSADGEVDERYILVIGGHRVAAAKELGWHSIPSFIVEDGLTNERIELLEIDENLCRAELGPAELSINTARRKELYVILHPGTAADAFHGNRYTGSLRQVGDGYTDRRFTAETAERTGRSERAIQRDVERGKALKDDAQKIVGTSLDKGSEIDALIKMDQASRQSIIERAVNGEKVSARKVVDVPEQEDREQIEAKKKRKLMAAWNDSPPSVQQWFLDNVRPDLIMDERFGG